MLQLYIYLGSFSILSSDNTVLMVLWGLGTKTHLNEFAKRPGFVATNMAGGVLVCPLRWSVYPAMSHFQMLTHSLRLWSVASKPSCLSCNSTTITSLLI